MQARTGLALLVVLMLPLICSQPASAQGGAAVQTQERIEREWGLSFADVARVRLCSTYCTGNRFAELLAITPEQLQQLRQAHEWDLMPPRALKFQNQPLPQGRLVRVSAGNAATVADFATETGEPAPQATHLELSADRYALHLTITCDEPQPQALVATVDPEHPMSPKEKAYWEGDQVALNKKHMGGGLNKLIEWADGLEPLRSSVLLDDCVVIFLTAVDAGKDTSHLVPLSHVPDPHEALPHLKPREPNRIYLEGAFYFVAVNPLGAVLDVFYDPWESGTFCPAWPSGAEVETTVGADSWQAEVRLPLRSLMPVVSEGATWGLDFMRLRRAGADRTHVTRGTETVFVTYDLASGVKLPPRGWVPQMSAHALPPSQSKREFPTRDEWAGAPLIEGFFEYRSGKQVEGVRARVAHDDRHLFVRFDCQEKDLSRLKVVTREEEIEEYGETNRRSNYLDRREAYGLDWGDYVEVLLAPNLDFADRHHGGYFDFLVNSQGDLLERHYDRFGMCNVAPHPAWQSGSRARVARHEDSWTVELAIPFDVLCTEAKVSGAWGLNLHRCRSTRVMQGREQHLLWSPTFIPPPHPDWARQVSARPLRNPVCFAGMQIDPAAVELRSSPKRPGQAVARPAEVGPPAERDHRSDHLSSVCFVDSRRGWAVGGIGAILHTDDGGATWHEQHSGTDFMLEDVFFADESHGWAVGGWPRDSMVALFGGMGIILATDDGGKTWRPQLEAEAAWLSSVFFVDDNAGWAVGEYGTMLRTTDGGKSWEQARHVSSHAWLYDVHFLDERRGWAVGFDETILRTDDGGETWSRQQAPVGRRTHGWPASYNAIVFTDEHDGWVVGDWGNILRTEDGGESWTPDEVGLPESVLDLACFSDVTLSSDGTAWAVSPVALLNCPPGQQTWRLVKTGVPAWLRGLTFADDSHGWLVADRNTIIATDDGGSTWHSQRDSGREMGLLYACPHDHHINGSPLAYLSEEFDTAYAMMMGGRQEFEMGGYYHPKKVAAAAMTLGVAVVHSFTEFIWNERDHPHKVAQRYQAHGGLEPVEMRLVAMIRALRPQVLIAEGPIAQEGYYAHGIGETARSVIAAFDSAGDPDKFPELAEVGLEPWAPKKLYIICYWVNRLYDIHPETLRVRPDDPAQAGPRLGMTYSTALGRAHDCFWGLLDRGEPPRVHGGWAGSWSLHLKGSRVATPDPEQSVYDGIP